MNALLLLDKPQGMTSHDVVARVRRLCAEKAVGHLGTLDPMATGLLPLLLGKWTRLARFYSALPKSYTGTIRFGYATDTYDAEGVAAGPVCRPCLPREELLRAAAALLGESEQMPPPFSAKKVGGKPAYTLARAGKQPELRVHLIHVAHFTLGELEKRNDDTVDVAFALQISAGGYVRSIAHALGEQFGCGAHLAALRRTAAGPLQVTDAWALESLEDALRSGKLLERLPHARTVLPELPSVTADAATLMRLRHGMQVCLPEYSGAAVVKVFANQGELAAIVDRVAGVLFQPSIVLL